MINSVSTSHPASIPPTDGSNILSILPDDILKIIIKHLYTQQDALILVCRKFRWLCLQDKKLVSPELMELMDLNPITLVRTSSMLPLPIQALDVIDGKLVYPKLQAGSSPIRMRKYDPSSGLIESSMNVKNVGAVHSLYSDGEGGLLINCEFRGSFYTNPELTLQRSIEIETSTNRVIYSNANSQGLLAGMSRSDTKIYIYNTKGELIKEIQACDGLRKCYDQTLILSDNYVYISFLDTCSLNGDRRSVIRAFNLSDGSQVAEYIDISMNRTPSSIALGKDYLALVKNRTTIEILEAKTLRLKKIISLNPPDDSSNLEAIVNLKAHDGHLFANLSSGRIGIWELSNGNLFGYIKRNISRESEQQHKFLEQMVINDHYIAITCFNPKQVEVYEIYTGRLIHIFPTAADPSFIKFDQNYLAVGLKNGVVQFWQPNAKAPLSALNQRLANRQPNTNGTFTGFVRQWVVHLFQSIQLFFATIFHWLKSKLFSISS